MFGYFNTVTETQFYGIRHLQKRKNTPLPFLSPFRGEALKPPFPHFVPLRERREGGKGG